MKIYKNLILRVSLAALIFGCDTQQAMSEVNDENGRVENIFKIENKEARGEFSSKCFLRQRYKKSPKPVRMMRRVRG